MTAREAVMGASALPRSELNDFLFATIGVEASGTALSVLSLFARAGLDPWQEARRLAALPRAKAADALSCRFTAMEFGAGPTLDAMAKARQLVALLPGDRDAAMETITLPGRGSIFTHLRLAMGLAALAGLLALQTWGLSASGRAGVAENFNANCASVGVARHGATPASACR